MTDTHRPSSPVHLDDSGPADHDGSAVPGRHEVTADSVAVSDLIAKVRADGHGESTPSDTARNGTHPNETSDADANADAAPDRGPTGGPEPHKWWTLVAVCLGTFMLLLDVTIVNVALPDIQRALTSSFSDLQWVVDAYALTLAALLLTAGSLADLFGRRRLYLIGLTIFTLASLLCGVAQDTLLLQLSRGLQGVGGAIMFSVSLALLADAFRGKDRGTAFGIWGAITGLAVAIGPLLGGVLTELSWRWIFFVNLPIGIVAIVLVVLRVAESRAPKARRPDWPGFVVFTVALAALIYGLIESSERSFGDSRVVTSLIAAAVLLVGFVLLEAFGKHPMFDLTLFRKPTFVGGAIAAFGLSASIFALLLYLTLYIQDVLGFSPLGTGLRLLVLSGGVLVVATIAGRLTSHVPIRFLIGPGLLIIGVGLLLMRGLSASSSWTHLVPGLILSGAGVGLVNPPLASTAVGVVTPERAGMASGINSTFRQVGIATGIALLGTLFASKVRSEVMSLASGSSLHIPAGTLATAVKSGSVGALIKKAPPQSRGQIEHITASAFTSGLDRIFLVAAVVVLASGVAALALIRQKDFVQQH